MILVTTVCIEFAVFRYFLCVCVLVLNKYSIPYLYRVYNTQLMSLTFYNWFITTTLISIALKSMIFDHRNSPSAHDLTSHPLLHFLASYDIHVLQYTINEFLYMYPANSTYWSPTGTSGAFRGSKYCLAHT